jgi:transposase
VVLTLRSGGSKLEREISTQKGKRSCRRRERTFTKEFKLEAVQLVRSSNKSQAQIARDLGIADSTLHHWCKLLSEQGEQAFPGSGHQTPQEEEIRHLKRENDLLRQERDILKKAIGIFSRGQV